MKKIFFFSGFAILILSFQNCSRLVLDDVADKKVIRNNVAPEPKPHQRLNWQFVNSSRTPGVGF